MSARSLFGPDDVSERVVLRAQTPEEAALEDNENARAQRRKAREVSPAPWSYEDTYDAPCGSCCTPDGCPEHHRAGLYRITGPDWYDYDVVYPDVVCNEADARLIAAAPELLAVAEKCETAIRRLADRLDSEPGNETAVAIWLHLADETRAAIAKAEGR